MGLTPRRRVPPGGGQAASVPRVTVPAHVRADRTPHGGMVVLDVRSGQWYALNASAAILFEHWRAEGDFEAAAAAVARRFPRTGIARVRQDAEELAAELMNRGLLRPAGRLDGFRRVLRSRARLGKPPPAPSVPASSAPPPARPASPSAAAPPGRPAGLRRPRAVAALGLLAALVLCHSPFRTAPLAVRAAKRLRARRPATPEQARTVLAALHRVGRHYPGRLACVEESLATVLGLALAGLTADWCLGYAPDPYRFHAWVEVAGTAVARPGGDDGPARAFHRVLTV